MKAALMEEPVPSGRTAEVRIVTHRLLSTRSVGGTVCPSEAARDLAARAGQPENWRDLMPLVHAAVDEMLLEGEIRLSWKGQLMEARRGPYRILQRKTVSGS